MREDGGPLLTQLQLSPPQLSREQEQREKK